MHVAHLFKIVSPLYSCHIFSACIVLPYTPPLRTLSCSLFLLVNLLVILALVLVAQIHAWARSEVTIMYTMYGELAARCPFAFILVSPVLLSVFLPLLPYLLLCPLPPCIAGMWQAWLSCHNLLEEFGLHLIKWVFLAFVALCSPCHAHSPPQLDPFPTPPFSVPCHSLL